MGRQPQSIVSLGGCLIWPLSRGVCHPPSTWHVPTLSLLSQRVKLGLCLNKPCAVEGEERQRAEAHAAWSRAGSNAVPSRLVPCCTRLESFQSGTAEWHSLVAACRPIRRLVCHRLVVQFIQCVCACLTITDRVPGRLLVQQRRHYLGRYG